MLKSTKILVTTLGIITGFMGIEHGIGEILQGLRPVNGVFILSWPDSPFFAIMSGEPAMTVFPNYFSSGLFAILFSCLLLVVSLLFIHKKFFIPVLLVLTILMLLSGAGFGPPLLGIITTLIAQVKIPVKLWPKLPAGLDQLLGKLWPFSYGLCLASWLMLFPGAALVAHFTGCNNTLLMIIPICFAFCLIPVTLLTGFSRDINQSGNS